MSASSTNSRLAFGLYEIDLQSGELWKAGFRIKLQSQPFKVLTALLEKSGQVVTREELQLRLWGRDTVVDFDHSLGTAINKIREALGDSAENPRFIETLSRRGYRFIAPVSVLPDPPSSAPLAPPAAAILPAPVEPDPGVVDPLPSAANGQAALVLLHEPGPLTGTQPETQLATPPAIPAELEVSSRKRPPAASARRALQWTGGALLAAIALAAAYLFGASRARVAPIRITRITQSGHLSTSPSSLESLIAGVTDGVHLFAPLIDNGHATLAAISLTDGTVGHVDIPAEVASPNLGDISPDGSRLLLRQHLSPEAEQPLWVVPTIGGSAQLVGNALAHDATWMPDGNRILFANGNDLYLTQLNGNNPEMFAHLPGRAFWMRWSPDGKLLRFTIIDPIAHTLALWQLTPSNRKPVPILTGFNQPSAECCGVWNADGSRFIFQSSRSGNTDLWTLKGTHTGSPVRLTDGPLQFQSPVAARTGNRLYFLGIDARSELERLTPAGLVAEKGFLASAVRVDYSRDGKWVAWTNAAGQLWRARTDGNDQLQLTPDGLSVFLARWSPDGSRIACMAREPGRAWQLYLIGANGNDFHPVLREQRNAADPSWSPDGKTLVFGRVNDAMGKESASRTLEYVDLQTGNVQPVPGSANLFSPRWSPDGRYIAALSLDQQTVRLFDVSAQHWTTLPVASGADPVWSRDSHFLYVHASLAPEQPIDRISIPEGSVQEMVKLAGSTANNAVDYIFGGLTPDNMPLIRTRSFTGDVYSLELP